MKKMSPLAASLLLSSIMCVPSANAADNMMEDWYLRADVGNTNWSDQDGLINNRTSANNTDMRPRWDIGQRASYGLGIGTELSHNLRTDLTVQQTRFATASDTRVQVGYIADTFGDLSTRVRATSTLANLYWDLGHYVGFLRNNHINPYIGGGAGLSHNKMGGTIEKTAGTQTVISHIPGHTRWSPSWQLGGGVSYQIGKMPLALDLSYVHLDAGTARSDGQMDVNSTSREQLTSPSRIHLEGNRWALGLRWYF